VTVTVTVRCAELLEDDADDEPEGDGDDEEAVDVAAELASLEDVPEPGAAPQAASPATRAAHPAYRRVVGHVILVTIRSLDRPF